MPIRILLRRGNANTWISANPVLSAGEVGVETDTGLFKIGDSSNTWANLRYFYPGTNSTSNILEGTNLYFTNTRSVGALTAGFGVSIDANGLVTANVGAVGGALTTSDVAEGTNLYFSNGRVYSNVISLGYSTNSYVNVRLNTKANVSDLTTANVTEVNNLYFTNSRSIGALTSGAGISIAANGRVTGLGAVTSVAGQIGAISNAQLAAAVSTANIVTTTQVAEGANLYFTNTRAIGALTGGAGISIAANGRITGLGAVTSVVGQIGDVSSSQIAAALNGQNVIVNDLTVQGDFTVNGNITTLNTASLNVEDKNIVLANGAANGAAADGAGFSISGAYANLTYVNSVDRFSINKYLDVIGNTVLTNANTTTHLSEGNNLYFTNVRVYANVIELAYAPNAYVNTRLLTKANVADLTTTNVAEGSNQYYTNVRVQQYLGALAGNIIPTSNELFNLGSSTRRFKDLFLSGTTIALGETLLKSDPALGGFTVASSNVEQTGTITFSVAANSVLISDIVTTNVITVDSITSNNWGGIYTGNVVETSGNLYFTNSRAIGALTAGRGVEIAANGRITTLYNFEKIAGISNGIVSNIQLAYAIQDTPLLNTSNIIEGSNLYYTNARVAANVATLGYAQNTYVNARLATKTDVTALNIYATNTHVTAVVNLLQTTKANNEDVTNLTTSNIPEGANLYFTNNRAISAIYAGQAIIIDSNGMISANVSQIGGGTITSIAGVSAGAVANDQIAAALTDRNISLIDLSASGQTILNDVTVNGDLLVNGTTTFINSTEVSINDINLVLANNAASPEVADGAGISISGAYANLTYGSQFDRFSVNKYLDVLGKTVLTNANTTTHLSEGTNLYFTNTRAVAAFNPGSGIIISSNGYIAINQSNIGAISSISSTPAAINFIVGSTGQRYLIDPYFGFNPQLKVYAGQTVAFDLGTGLNINNHPFTIKTSYGGSNISTGLSLVTTDGVTLSGSSAQGNVSGRMLWRVPPTLGGNSYVYQSTSNAQVFGNIFVIPQQYFSGLGSEVSANGLVTNTGVIQVAGANSYVTNIQLAVAVNDLLNTSNIAEGSNLYYTNTRVNAYINDTIFQQLNANTTNVNYSNVTTLFNLGGTIFYPQDDTGFSINRNVDIGNSTIRAFNFNTGETHEKIVLGLSHSDQFTHGIGAYGSSANSFLVIGTGDNTSDIVFKKNLGVPFEITGGSTLATITREGNIVVTGKFIGDVQGTVSSIENHTTSNLPEGSNLYFTNSRAVSALTPGVGIYISANGLITSQAAGTTDDVAEGSNLYYSNARVQSYLGNVSGNILPSTSEVYSLGSPTKKWKDIYLSGNTLVLGNTKIESSGDGTISIRSTDPENTTVISLNSNGQITSESGPLTTGNIVEDSNLYFTNARARAVIQNGTGVFYNPANGYINIGQDVRPTSSVEFKDLLVTGNVIFAGNAAVINTTSLSITDNMIYLNESKAELIANIIGDGSNVTYYLTNDHTGLVGQMLRVTSVNPSSFNIPYTNIIAVTSNSITVTSNVVATYVSGGNAFIKAAVNPDLGFSGGYNDGTYHHAGLFRDASDGIWKFFDSYTPEPDSNVFIDTNHASFRLANVSGKTFYGNIGGGAANSLVLQSAADRTSFVSPPSIDYTYLRYDGANGITWGTLYESNSVVYTANSISLDPSYGTYNSGNVLSIRTVGDYNLDSNNYYSINETATTPGYVAYIDFIDVQNFNRILINLFYTQNSGHTIYVDLKNKDTLAWDSFGTYSGLGTYYQFALSVIDPIPYIQAGNKVELRLYHASPGNTSHNHRIDYVALELTTQGPQGPKGTTGSTGATGAGVATGGTAGQILIKANSTNYATYWGDPTTSNISEGSNLYFTNSRSIGALTAGSGIVIQANGLITSTALGGVQSVNGANGNVTLTTANIAESGNLYFTNTRAISAFTAGSGIVLESNGLITSTATGGGSSEFYSNTNAPASASLGSLWYNPDFGNLFVYVTDGTSNVWLEIDDSGAAANTYLTSIISQLTTTDIKESSGNIYFTNTRAVGALTAGSGIVIAANGRITSVALGGVQTVNGANGNVLLTTANISEQGNLYFTNTRVVSALTSGDGISIAANGRITSTATGGSGSTTSYTREKTFYFPGDMAIQSSPVRWYPQYSFSITTIRARVTTAPSGSDILLNVRKNGNVVSTLSIINGLDRTSINTNISFGLDDFITIDVASVGSQVRGSDLVVDMIYTGLGTSRDKSFNFPGELSIRTGSVRWYPIYSSSISTIRARLTSSPTGGDLNLNIRKNGNVVATMSILDGTDRANINTNIPITLDDYLTVDVTSVGRIYRGSDLVVSMIYTG